MAIVPLLLKHSLKRLKKGHSVKRFDAAYLNIGPCHGCDTCFKTGKACTFDDDFNTVAPYIEEADAVILATPTYWFSIPGKVKCLIDKLYSFCVGKKKPLPVKKLACSALAGLRAQATWKVSSCHTIRPLTISDGKT